MNNPNPYESPRAKSAVDEDFRRWPFDIGKFVGRYLLGLGVLSIGSMVVGALFFDTLNINVMIIFYFVAGAYLIKHNPTARLWVIGLSGLAFLGILAMTLLWMAGGTRFRHDIYISVGYKQINNPSLGYMLGWATVLLLLTGIPLFLLLTRQARAEFQRTPNWPQPVPMPHEEDVPGKEDS